jgi:hypothetical protein
MLGCFSSRKTAISSFKAASSSGVNLAFVTILIAYVPPNFLFVPSLTTLKAPAPSYHHVMFFGFVSAFIGKWVNKR